MRTDEQLTLKPAGKRGRWNVYSGAQHLGYIVKGKRGGWTPFALAEPIESRRQLAQAAGLSVCLTRSKAAKAVHSIAVDISIGDLVWVGKPRGWVRARDCPWCAGDEDPRTGPEVQVCGRHTDDAQGDVRTISGAAAELNVREADIRRWEREGLFVPKRDERNWRGYTDRDIKALRKIKREQWK